MKLVAIDVGQCARLVHFSGPFGGVYLGDLLNSFKNRYGFLKCPDKIEDIDFKNPITFSHGKFLIGDNGLPKLRQGTDHIQIQTLQFYRAGILASGPTSTEDIDVFLEDVLAFLNAEFKFSINENTDIGHNYLSRLMVVLDAFPSASSIEAKLSSKIEACLEHYGASKERFGFAGFTLACDVVNAKIPKPYQFIIDRDRQLSISANQFITDAPLTTSDHLDLLRLLEKLAAGR
jgi:hypothetical protein